MHSMLGCGEEGRVMPKEWLTTTTGGPHDQALRFLRAVHFGQVAPQLQEAGGCGRQDDDRVHHPARGVQPPRSRVRSGGVGQPPGERLEISGSPAQKAQYTEYRVLGLNRIYLFGYYRILSTIPYFLASSAVIKKSRSTSFSIFDRV